MYDGYINQLSALQNNLYENGLSSATRRDLSAARNTYASDITRLKTAIQSRQERSKEYWDARHKDPSLVTGFDPAMGGLDDYLNDSEYGRNWYSYSGDQFASEVGMEAKARAAEMMNASVGRDPNLAGYLAQIVQNGFTNTQVDDAGALAWAVLNGQARLEDAPVAEQILAGSLISRLQSTGAQPGKNLSSDEFMRLFNYGRLGLSQAVGSSKLNMLNDKVWDQRAALSQISARAAASRKTGSDETPSNGGGYAIDGVAGYNATPDFAKQNALYRKNVHDYDREGPILANVRGRQTVIANESDAERVFEDMGRGRIMQTYGIDPELDIRGRNSKHVVETTARNGADQEIQLRYVPMHNDQQKRFANDSWMNSAEYKYEPVAVEQKKDGKWYLDESLTRRFNNDNYYYQRQRQALIDENKGNKDFNIDKIALVGDARRKFYEKADIPADIPTEYARAIHDTRNRQNVETNAVIANSSMPAALEEYSGKMRERYALGTSTAGKNGIGKTSDFAFYPVLEGGIGYSGKGETDAAKIFGTKGSGSNTTVDYGNVVAFGVTPEDIYDYNKIELVTGTNKKYGVDPKYLGNYVSGTTQGLQNPVLLQDGRVLDEKGIIHYLMLPISDPVRVARMSDAEQNLWWSVANNLLGMYAGPDRMNFMIEGNESMPTYLIGAQQILMDTTPGGLQSKLRNSVTDLLNTVYADPRDYSLQHRMQSIGLTSTKAQPYNNR